VTIEDEHKRDGEAAPAVASRFILPGFIDPRCHGRADVKEAIDATRLIARTHARAGNPRNLHKATDTV